MEKKTKKNNNIYKVIKPAMVTFFLFRGKGSSQVGYMLPQLMSACIYAVFFNLFLNLVTTYGLNSIRIIKPAMVTFFCLEEKGAVK